MLDQIKNWRKQILECLDQDDINYYEVEDCGFVEGKKEYWWITSDKRWNKDSQPIVGIHAESVNLM